MRLGRILPGSLSAPAVGGWALLAVLLALQAALGQSLDPRPPGATAPSAASAASGRAQSEALLPAPPPTWLARWALLGESRLAAYVAALRVQTADAQRGVGAGALRVSELDPDRVLQWLDHGLALDPTTAYPLLLAARVHAEVHGIDGGRRILQWLRARFGEDPDRRWPWLVHGVYVARHVFGDLALARELAGELRTRATGPAVPAWVRQVEPLLLADMGQLEAARTLVGALVTSGAVREPSELSFLAARLRELEEAAAGADPSMASSRHSMGVSRE